jgi:hypothetical protein
MAKPDFAYTNLHQLENRDLQFLIENMPAPGKNYQEIAEVIQYLPTTVESMLTSDYLFHAILDRRQLLLDISPFLLFSVLLRRSLSGHRSALDRRVINYLANLLSLFVHTDRVYRVRPGDATPREYLVDLIQDAEQADSQHQFIIHAHIGNYALYLTGLFPQWIEHRHQYRRRPVNINYYVDFGRSYFDLAAKHSLARDFNLSDVFFRLAVMFEHYQQGLNRMANHFLPTR